MNLEKLIDSIPAPNARSVDDALHVARRALEENLQMMRRPPARVGLIDSPLGDLLVAVGKRGLAMIHYVQAEEDIAEGIARLRYKFDLEEEQSAVKPVAEEIRGYLKGDEGALHQQIDLTLAANGFEKKALTRLLAVPRGALISYQALGAAAGAPRGARAVGNAMHENPIPVYVPCHRVICSDGRIGGYGGGLERKRMLLRAEGFAADSAWTRVPDGFIYGHRGTKIYCRPSCYTGARVDRSRLLFFADSAHARRAGMRACKVCRPA